MSAPDRAGSASRRLLAAAGPEVYLRNPFRVTGLPTDAAAKVLRQRRQLLQLRPDGAADARLPLPETATPQQVKAAFEVLEQPEQRLIAELFWWWGEPGECGCPVEIHQAHDDAIRAHAEILDLEAALAVRGEDRVDRWTDAADAWLDAVEQDAFWRHLAHRMRALRDRRLDESTVDGLRAVIGQALLEPQVALARTRQEPVLMELLEVWDLDGDLVYDARLRAAEPVLDRTKALTSALREQLDRGHSGAAAELALNELVPMVDLLERAVPADRFRRAARVRDQAAVLLNNSALALDDDRNQRQARQLLEHAIRLAIDPDTRRRIEENQQAQVSESLHGQIEAAITLVKVGNHLGAVKRLRELRAKAVAPGDIALLESLLAQLGRSWFTAGPAPVRRPPRSAGWLAQAAVCLWFVAGLTWIGAALGMASRDLGIATALVSVLPVTVVQADWFRYGPMASWSRVGAVVTGLVPVGVVLAVLWGGQGPAMLLTALGAFLLALVATVPLGQIVLSVMD
ncbi:MULTISPECIES: hypothetical protein [unclassified Crossiella]|uniref:hypothetical protein n=1 Tax=unclassified Crossiella TaxID=2620835 RepID=UPI001FFF4665|nr:MULTISPECIES: hypothetical protein [unclassified Crossiella]MCK2242973.1 hypothetical protein [Crossiella sp. S99.2]MCK2256850.1 hypothetical protein [Crossiella sp. S99.1]